MKKVMVMFSALIMTSMAYADQMGRVVSVTPINQSVAVPSQVCNQEYVNRQVYNANAGNAIIGAVAGGLIGNAIGGGRHGGYYGYRGNNNGAIALGAIGGAVIGSQVGATGGYVSQPVQNCYTQNNYQNRVVGYNVTYRLNGRTYTTQTDNYPGQYIRVDNYDSGYNNNYNNNYYDNNYDNNYHPPVVYNNPAPVIIPPPVYVAPPVYVTPPVYMAPAPVYYGHRPYYRRW